MQNQKIKDLKPDKEVYMNYFRITVYNPKYDFSAILDANGKYNELWEFSAY